MVTGSDEEAGIVAELVSCNRPSALLNNDILKLRKGASGARGDDTKSLKGAILEWIAPKGQALSPPLSRNVKVDRGFNHEVTGALLCPTNLKWSDLE